MNESNRRAGWGIVAILCVVLGACGSPRGDQAAAPDASGTAVQSLLRLDAWIRTGEVWEEGANPLATCDQHHVAQYDTTFTLTSARLPESATLIMPGLWWRGRVSVNGVELDPVDGGLAPAEVEVGGHLRAGENSLRVVVEGPSDQPTLVTNGCVRQPELGPDVRLVLHPPAWIHSSAMVARGDDVGARVRTRGQPEGARVHVEAWLDGERQRWSGSAAVDADGVARIAPAAWKGPRWQPGVAGEESLVHLAATLVDGSGQVLDRVTRRTGVRELRFAEGQLYLDGERYRMMVIRAEPDEPPHGQLATLRPAGVNGVEIHGVAPSSTWLAEADELGLPVVVLPRCDGSLWMDVTPRERRSLLAERSDELLEQDRELAWRTAVHPSLALWACEGEAYAANALCTGLSGEDPRSTPAAGVQFTSWPLPAEGFEGQPHHPDLDPGATDAGPGWVVELTGNIDQVTPYRAATTFVEAGKGGAVGGVITHPGSPGRAKDWREAWSGAAQELEIPQLAQGERRASARVRVRQLDPGEVAWLEVPGLTPAGAVADTGGVALLESWHRGAATVVVGERSQEVRLTPDSWLELRRVPATLEIDWPSRDAEP